MKKVICFCILLFISLLVGCMDSGIEIDPTKTQLYIQYFDGGVGGEWLDKVISRFEEEYADYEFESGKNGAEIIPIPTKSVMLYTVPNSTYNLYFTEDVDYFTYASQGFFLDISDIVSEKNISSENNTIESKLNEIFKTSLTSIDGNYYAIPHYEFFHSVMYDVDLFEEKKLFFADNRDNGNNGFIIKSDDKRSAGLDGIYNTFDDGLPVTYDEFFQLCNYMLLNNITPFVWTGEYAGYLLKFLSQLAASYSGYESWYSNYSFSGQAKIVTNYATMESELIEISEANGYLLSRQTGMYQALSFLERILSNPQFYSGNSLSTTQSHLDAQEEFIYSKLDNKPIGMLIEGTFWLNEAKDIFARSVQDKGDRAKNRNFGIMRLPSVPSGEVNGYKTTLLDNASSYAFINANIADKPDIVHLAKTFLQYCYTDKSLQEFTLTTGMSKAVNYDLTEEQFNQLSSYSQNLWDLKNDADIIYQISDNDFFLNNSSIFALSSRFTSTVANTSYLLPIKAMRSGISAKEYFMGMEVTQNDWNENYQ